MSSDEGANTRVIMSTQAESMIKTSASAWMPAHWSVATPPASAKALNMSGNTGTGSEEEDVWPRLGDDPESKHARSKQKKSPQLPQSWLDRDPFEWIGKKVRSRKTAAIFTVRNVYRNGRVDLEKSWMTYSYPVETIRTDFEVHC
jgi:hypothetical protein